MARETIGYLRCAMTHEIAEVRRDKRGRLYYIGEAGKIPPSGQMGQAWIENNMRATREELEEQDTEEIPVASKPEPEVLAPVAVQHTEPEPTPTPPKTSHGFWGLMRTIFLEEDEAKKTA